MSRKSGSWWCGEKERKRDCCFNYRQNCNSQISNPSFLFLLLCHRIFHPKRWQAFLQLWMSFIASLFALVSRAPTRIWQQVNSQLLLIWQGIWWYVCRDFVMHLQLYAQPFVCSGLSLYVPISVHVCRHLINSKLWLTLMVYQNMKSSLCYTVTLTRVNSIGIETIFLI